MIDLFKTKAQNFSICRTRGKVVNTASSGKSSGNEEGGISHKPNFGLVSWFWLPSNKKKVYRNIEEEIF